MPGKKINEPCSVCGKTKEEGFKLGRFEGNIYCIKHLKDMQKYREIRPHLRNILTTCSVCGNKSMGRWSKDNKEYCRKHYMQMYHHGHILERTIFDKNTYIDHPNDGYTECITYDKNLNESFKVIIDLDKKDIISKYKVYVKGSKNKHYATISINSKKIFLHRFLMGFLDTNYVLYKTVDHINGNSLDNRISNLRICSQADNMKNIKKKNTIVGVSWLKFDKKWTARIMSNYKHFHIGNYDTYEEAVLARLRKEKEIFNDFGPNKNLYYILNHSFPIKEIQRVITIPENPVNEV